MDPTTLPSHGVELIYHVITFSHAPRAPCCN